MYSDCLFDCGINIIVNSSFFENFLNRESSAGNLENRGATEEIREFLSVHGRRSNDEFDVTSFLGYFFKNAEQNVSVQTSFVGLIHYNRAVHLEFRVIETFPEQHTVCHVLNNSLFRSTILKTY